MEGNLFVSVKVLDAVFLLKEALQPNFLAKALRREGGLSR
jgi:hypothetical protein